MRCESVFLSSCNYVEDFQANSFIILGPLSATYLSSKVFYFLASLDVNQGLPLFSPPTNSSLSSVSQTKIYLKRIAKSSW